MPDGKATNLVPAGVSRGRRTADMFINATRDGYLMSLRANVNHRLAIGNSTPCVWRNKTPSTSP